MSTELTNSDTSLVVVSYYDRRPTTDLLKLLGSMHEHDAGARFEVQLVVNRAVGAEVDIPKLPFKVSVAYRENTGMNIGAWDHGWRINRGRPAYVFIQDECVVTRAGWLRAYLQRIGEPGVGMVGESLNTKWNKSWSQLEALNLGVTMADHFIDGVAADRVAVYLHALNRWGVDPGDSGLHLRSLVWALPDRIMERIGGFPLGANYGECIAAEIAVGRAVAALGCSVAQVSEREFYYIWHSEWNQDFPGECFSHSKSRAKAAGFDLPEIRQKLDADMESLVERLDRLEGVDRALAINSLLLRLQDKDREIAALRALTKTRRGG